MWAPALPGRVGGDAHRLRGQLADDGRDEGVRGWSVSAIARHSGRDRKTIRKCLHGPRSERERAPSCLEPYRAYIAARFDDDPHLLGSVLYRELVDAGFERAYTTMVGELRR